jgi:hypothetical protein
VTQVKYRRATSRGVTSDLRNRDQGEQIRRRVIDTIDQRPRNSAVSTDYSATQINNDLTCPL